MTIRFDVGEYQVAVEQPGEFHVRVAVVRRGLNAPPPLRIDREGWHASAVDASYVGKLRTRGFFHRKVDPPAEIQIRALVSEAMSRVAVAAGQHKLRLDEESDLAERLRSAW